MTDYELVEYLDEHFKHNKKITIDNTRKDIYEYLIKRKYELCVEYFTPGGVYKHIKKLLEKGIHNVNVPEYTIPCNETNNERNARLLKYCLTSSGKIYGLHVCNLKDEDKTYLLDLYKNEYSLRELITFLKFNISYDDIPYCPICKKRHRKHHHHNIFLNTCCSRYCFNQFAQQQRTKFIHEKYGDEYDNFYQIPEIKDKIKDINRAKRGVEYASQDPVVKAQVKKTLNERYGVDAGFLTPKTRDTLMERYGVDNPAKCKQFTDKAKQTNIERYGGPSPSCDKNVMNKAIDTCMQHYGVKYGTQTEQCIKASHTPEAIEKCIETQRQNGTLNRSIPEIETYEAYLKVFPDAKHNYVDKKLRRYKSWKCDIYLPSLDIFIECQYGPSHHPNKKLRPFNGSSEDVDFCKELIRRAEQREKITGKKSKYRSYLKTWSIDDVNKRNTAKENNIKYIEFWTKEQALSWLNDYKEGRIVI